MINRYHYLVGRNLEGLMYVGKKPMKSLKSNIETLNIIIPGGGILNMM